MRLSNLSRACGKQPFSAFRLNSLSKLKGCISRWIPSILIQLTKGHTKSCFKSLCVTKSIVLMTKHLSFFFCMCLDEFKFTFNTVMFPLQDVDTWIVTEQRWGLLSKQSSLLQQYVSLCTRCWIFIRSAGCWQSLPACIIYSKSFVPKNDTDAIHPEVEEKILTGIENISQSSPFGIFSFVHWTFRFWLF